LDRAKGTKEYETALAIPHRARIGRTVDKPRKGVLLFGRKKDTCVFKMSANLLDTDTLNTEEAFALLEADIFEQPKSVSANFDAVYQNMKQTLFKSCVTEKTDKQKKDVLDKIDAIAQAGVLDAEYINALRYAVEIGALSGLSMQFIRQLAPKDFSELPRQIDQDFLDRVQKMAREIDEGSESIILSEELQ
jgi:uncharacterized protein YaaN involved in tellurite resistance